MAIPEEKRREIIEEEELRAKVRLKYEQKSSGIAGVLSTVVPGLGQIYNGQFGKGTFFSFTVLLGLILLSTGITFWVKGTPSFNREGTSIVQSEEEQPIQMDESGVVIEENQKEPEEKPQLKQVNIPKLPASLTLGGLILLLSGWSFAIKDAIKTAKLLNISYP
ncbi:hypothetical protein J7K25_03455 [bacterium]|nr:hypothetical protein [bacterium]